MSIHDEGNVLVPSLPYTPLVLIQSEFFIELLVVLLDFPAAFGDAGRDGAE